MIFLSALMNQVISASQFMIIKATIHDVPDLNVLVNSAYRGESSKQGWTTEADLLGGIRVNDHRLIEMITTTDSQILKYLDEKNKILACVHLEKHGGKLYLGLLIVSPVLQGKGIGKELLSEAGSSLKWSQIACETVRTWEKVNWSAITARQPDVPKRMSIFRGFQGSKESLTTR